MKKFPMETAQELILAQSPWTSDSRGILFRAEDAAEEFSNF